MYNLESDFYMECGIYVGEMGGKSETLKRRCVNICCLEEMKWKGQWVKTIAKVLNFYGVGVVKQKTVWLQYLPTG